MVVHISCSSPGLKQPQWVNIAFPAGTDLLLTYEVPQSWTSSIQVGSFVLVEVGTRTTWALVLEFVHQKPSFEVKPILELLPYKLNSFDFEFWSWLAEYYMAPWNRVLDIVLTSQWFKYLGQKPHPTLPSIPTQLPPLTDEQKAALDTFNQNPREPHLLYGITGSGKTRVLLELAKQTLQTGQSVLWLVPEIALTPQMARSIEEGLGESILILHSGLGAKDKRNTWQHILQGDVRVLLGTRSALLAPMDKLGLIIVDEEHDSSYKQTDPSPRYHGRDASLWRAKQRQIPCVLASATPSLEMAYRVQKGHMRVLKLQSRPGQSTLPIIHLIDMKDQQQRQGQFALSIPLREALHGTLELGQQAILLHNRRGHAHAQICGQCGKPRECIDCDVALIPHQKINQAVCHYCDRKYPRHAPCRHCGSEDWIEEGFGIEKVEDELKDLFPNLKILRLDRDTSSRKGETDAILNAFRNQEASVLLGTQMVVKGHDFPNVTLVGVIGADQSLHIPDFRASENAFQLLTQVAGRAGRGEHPGVVYLQTYNPELDIIQLSQEQNWDAFFDVEMNHRKELNYPPFARILKIELGCFQPSQGRNWLNAFCQILRSKLKDQGSERLIGPSEAPVFRVRKEFRFQIMIFTNQPQNLRLAIHETLQQCPPKPKNWRLHFDMDPRS